MAGVASNFSGGMTMDANGCAAAVARSAGRVSILACSTRFPNGFVNWNGLLGYRVVTPLLDLPAMTALSTTPGAYRLPFALALGAFRATLAMTLRTGNATAAVAGRACRLAASTARGAFPCVTNARDAADAVACSERLVDGRGGLCLRGAPALNPLHNVRALGRDDLVDRAFHAGLGRGVAHARR